ncbi:hypothetical protein AG1IA_03390 [Rhizoctonia solani AG-1 IA]|uniref:Uncharacterized protein n=1 Tax=Thanatephorus cucumeris (strain AG1-IA) TaxID=983506 RepID=L8X0F3_THACA|nr:hypothetical protein AG1IA_03390 [Rhizoctonia solani AG-1 IA]
MTFMFGEPRLRYNEYILDLEAGLWREQRQSSHDTIRQPPISEMIWAPSSPLRNE